MSHTSESDRKCDMLVSLFWSGDAIRSRSVSDIVLSGTLDIPTPPTWLVADWKRETSVCLGLEPGDVEAMSLSRARARWPDYKHCVQAASAWTRALGLHDVIASSDVALMACRGAKYHHDAAHYGGMAFCNLFLSEDRGLDLHFPNTGHRIPLVRGTIVMFDTGQPHAVIQRGCSGLHLWDLPFDQDCTQVFLSWELTIEDANVGQLLQIELDTAPSTASLVTDEQVWLNGAPASVCPDSGLWRTERQPALPKGDDHAAPYPNECGEHA